MPELRWRENKAYGHTYGQTTLLLGKICIGEATFCVDKNGKRWLTVLGGEKLGSYPTEDEARVAVDAALRQALG